MTEAQKWMWLGLLALGGLSLYLLAPVLTPFMTALILAYVGNPLVERLTRWRLSRPLAVAVLFLVLALLLVWLLLVLVPLLERQIALLVSKIPLLLDWLQHRVLPWLQLRLGLADTPDLAALKGSVTGQWQSAGGLAAQLLGSISRSGMAVLGWLANLLLVPVVTFYLLRDWQVLLARLHELIPRHLESAVVVQVRAVDDVMGAFFRGQLLVMLALSVIYTVGLWIVGLDLALLIGMLAGLVSFVPYLGLVVGVIAAGIAALLQFQELMPLLYVLLVFGVAQLLEGTVLTPWLLGERIGLHPVAVIFAVLTGGHLFGFFGVLLALPVAAVAVVLLRYAHRRYLDSRLYSAANRG